MSHLEKQGYSYDLVIQVRLLISLEPLCVWVFELWFLCVDLKLVLCSLETSSDDQAGLELTEIYLPLLGSKACATTAQPGTLLYCFIL